MRKLASILAMLAVMFILGACSGNESETTNASETKEQPKQPEQTAELAQDEAFSLKELEDAKAGKYLADANGKTLYYFTKDEPGKSNCSGECLGKWPAFTQENLTVPQGYDEKDFGSIERADTKEKQVTYKGYPLYYFVKDQQAGDLNGQGVKDVWYIVNNETAFK